MYWFENIIYVLLFLIFEILISPFTYAKIWYNLLLILRTTDIGTTGIVKSVIYCLIWAFLGPFLMLGILAMDLWNFIVILSFHDGFTRTQ